MIIETDIDIVCSECGSYLDLAREEYVNSNTRQLSFSGRIFVSPCEKCMEERAKEEVADAKD